MALIRRFVSALWNNLYLWSAIMAGMAAHAIVSGNQALAIVAAFLCGAGLSCAFLDRPLKGLLGVCDAYERDMKVLLKANALAHETILGLLDALKMKGGRQ